MKRGVSASTIAGLKVEVLGPPRSLRYLWLQGEGHAGWGKWVGRDFEHYSSCRVLTRGRTWRRQEQAREQGCGCAGGRDIYVVSLRLLRRGRGAWCGRGGRWTGVSERECALHNALTSSMRSTDVLSGLILRPCVL